MRVAVCVAICCSEQDPILQRNSIGTPARTHSTHDQRESCSGRCRRACRRACRTRLRSLKTSAHTRCVRAYSTSVNPMAKFESVKWVNCFFLVHNWGSRSGAIAHLTVCTMSSFAARDSKRTDTRLIAAEIVSKKIQFSSRILIYYVVHYCTNHKSHGQNSGLLTQKATCYTVTTSRTTVVNFHPTKMVRRTCFVPGLY